MHRNCADGMKVDMGMTVGLKAAVAITAPEKPGHSVGIKLGKIENLAMELAEVVQVTVEVDVAPEKIGYKPPTKAGTATRLTGAARVTIEGTTVPNEGERRNADKTEMPLETAGAVTTADQTMAPEIRDEAVMQAAANVKTTATATAAEAEPAPPRLKPVRDFLRLKPESPSKSVLRIRM